MVLSQTSVYALKAVLHIAEHGPGAVVRVDDIATGLGVPRNYLSKILHGLAKASVLSSSRGPHGGFTLATPAEEMTIADVIRHFDSLVDQSACLLGRKNCSDANPCHAHERWKAVAADLRRFLVETTIADLARDPARMPTSVG